ncbi:CPBP family intramembrane glutamic endopeptidase [Streptococcus pantholopis]|uniref:CAAX prenyl protease 2/Lysostaphin resistance protein A-like domain-containing protein n=1 Tax=Streptococcus pantholopis TaxID=1811193 RepID=A0A172Q979_9STRE|nr:CPBP family intramembrane glutamic endopeptidase [Streptococcus pantholopis]AND80024.1 hypothetical protein A0O21_08420 [Streptococcus pantholopis]
MDRQKSIYTISLIYAAIMLGSYFYTFQARGISYSSNQFLISELPFLGLLAAMMVLYVMKNPQNVELREKFPLRRRYFFLGFVPLAISIMAFWLLQSHLAFSSIGIFVATICVGVGEELLFRKVLLAYFLERFPRKQAIIFSALCFGLFHAINLFAGSSLKGVILQVVVTTISGFYYAYLYLFTKKISWCAADHGLWDYFLTMITGKLPPIFFILVFLQQAFRLGMILFMTHQAKKIPEHTDFESSQSKA